MRIRPTTPALPLTPSLPRAVLAGGVDSLVDLLHALPGGGRQIVYDSPLTWCGIWRGIHGQEVMETAMTGPLPCPVASQAALQRFTRQQHHGFDGRLVRIAFPSWPVVPLCFSSACGLPPLGRLAAGTTPPKSCLQPNQRMNRL